MALCKCTQPVDSSAAVSAAEQSTAARIGETLFRNRGWLLGTLGAAVVVILLGVLFDSIQNADLPMIQGTVLLGAFFIVLANLVVDVLYAFLDPRVRYA